MNHEPCPTCAALGGYCGGSGHPSCGAFVRQCAVSDAQEKSYLAAFRAAIADGNSEAIAEAMAHSATIAAP